jgi:hypothetical protein
MATEIPPPSPPVQPGGSGPASDDQIGFSGGRVVDVRELDDRFWSVLNEFSYQAKDERFVVPVGEKTDFASVPRPFVWFIPTYGAYTKAAILHDHLCRLARAGSFDRRDADGVFRQAMRSLGVPFIRRWVMWAAVRWGALAEASGRKGWLRDAAKVVAISLPVLIIVGPAALLIMATLLVWLACEWIVLPVLWLGRRWRKRRGGRVKRVNQPTLQLNL